MLRFFRIWMHLLAGLVVLQFFLAGYGAIGTGDPSEAFALHIMNGRLIGAVALLGVLFAALARAGGRLVWLSAAVFGLVVLQSVIALVSVGGTVPGQIIFGFHALNGMFVMGVAEKTATVAKRLLQDRAEVGETAAATA